MYNLTDQGDILFLFPLVQILFRYSHFFMCFGERYFSVILINLVWFYVSPSCTVQTVAVVGVG